MQTSRRRHLRYSNEQSTHHFWLCKAFDRLWHKGLIEKLKAYGINGKLLQWLKDYISVRKQQVSLSNSISSLGTLKAGVPQGSVLGPLPFLSDIAYDI